MTVPYGDVVWGDKQEGFTLRYENSIGPGLFLESVAGYVNSSIYYRDLGRCIYSWLGTCDDERRLPGEISPGGADLRTDEHSYLLRPTITKVIAGAHTLRATTATRFVTRSGEDKQAPLFSPDPQSARRKLTTLVSGLEYEVDLLEDALETIAFLKHYFQAADTEELATGDVLVERDRTTQLPGVGASTRLRFAEWAYAKASYEWATRLPRAEEIFGDGARVTDNLELLPERSHNANIGIALDSVGFHEQWTPDFHEDSPPGSVLRVTCEMIA